MTITVITADDQPLVRAGLRMTIDSAPDVQLVGEAGDGHEAVRLACDLTPDVVLMDIRMPLVDGIEATRQILAPVDCVCRVIVLTTFDRDDYVFGALRAGASGFLLKDVPPEGLLAAIRTVAAGESLLSPAVTTQLIRLFGSQRGAGCVAWLEWDEGASGLRCEPTSSKHLRRVRA